MIPRKEIKFEFLEGKKIAIDFSNSAYQFLSSIRQPDGTPLMDSQRRITSHLMGIWTRFTNLMQRNIQLVIVLDGKAPILKIKEQEQRAHRKELAEEKLKQAQEDEDITSMAKYAKQTTRLSKEMVAEAQELMEAMGLPVIQAPSESDAQIAYMCQQGDVYAAATSDADVLMHGCPRVITNLTLSQRRKLPNGNYVKITPEIIELPEVLRSLDITQDQLIAIAVLVGTDYHPGIHRVGPKTALKLVKKNDSMEQLFREVEADFDWKEIMELFKKMPVTKEYNLEWGKPDVDKIKEILVDRHEFSPERVDMTLEKLQSTTKKKEQKGLGDFFK
ncbi:MAG TPA: flap endonuclease-1 [Candidatus Nanoarchaeia archaeon]|nr:flap endonuclease-1 [Candidatus Nanoarchaeia archaeon]